MQHQPHRTLRCHALDAIQIKANRAKTIDLELEVFSRKNHDLDETGFHLSL